MRSRVGFGQCPFCKRPQIKIKPGSRNRPELITMHTASGDSARAEILSRCK